LILQANAKSSVTGMSIYWGTQWFPPVIPSAFSGKFYKEKVLAILILLVLLLSPLLLPYSFKVIPINEWQTSLIVHLCFLQTYLSWSSGMSFENLTTLFGYFGAGRFIKFTWLGIANMWKAC
jgi:hypothetical protein